MADRERKTVSVPTKSPALRNHTKVRLVYDAPRSLAMKSCAFLHLGGEGKKVEAGRTFIGARLAFMHKAKRDRVITARGFKTRLRHSASWSAR